MVRTAPITSTSSESNLSDNPHPLRTINNVIVPNSQLYPSSFYLNPRDLLADALPQPTKCRSYPKGVLVYAMS